MALVLGLLVCLGLWWLLREGWRPPPALAALLRPSPRNLRRIGAWAALALAVLLLARGNIPAALVLGLGGVWLLQGPERLAGRLGSLLRRGRRRAVYRTTLIEIRLHPDGSGAEGRVRAGPGAGARLETLDAGALQALRALCAARDPEGLRLLEAYLDGRQAGGREDAEADADPGPGRPAQPGAMTQEEAYQILGLERGASVEAVRAAHRRLMKATHPDQGGSVAQAARVNAARDRLTNRHR